MEVVLEKTPLEQIRQVLAAGYPMVYLVSWEERRVEALIASVARTFYKERKLYRWSATEGFGGDAAKATPLQALDAVRRSPEPCIVILKDFHHYLGNDPAVTRKVRDTYHALAEDGTRMAFVISPILRLPEELQKEMIVIDFPLPDFQEMERIVDQLVESARQEKGLPAKLSEEERVSLVRAFLGLTVDEARYSFKKAILDGKAIDVGLIDSVLADKAQVVKKTGVLEYVGQRYGLDDVGGLDAMKEWLRVRAGFFSREAKDYSLTAPKGILLVGVSGCGKSLAVQTVAQYWHLPLFRLELNQLYSGTMESPEETLRRTFKILEAVSPCVLWIDEIEGGFAGYGAKGESDSGRIFASFLTWMQEKRNQVFVAATANRIDLLPPEILRKGRFDQIFFVDLPTSAERERIFRIHLTRRSNDLRVVNLGHLAASTKGFNGAEIEQVVVSAMFDAFSEKRPLEMQDLFKAIGATVPLSKTMYERIKDIKKWAHDRAINASTDVERERL